MSNPLNPQPKSDSLLQFLVEVHNKSLSSLEEIGATLCPSLDSPLQTEVARILCNYFELEIGPAALPAEVQQLVRQFFGGYPSRHERLDKKGFRRLIEDVAKLGLPLYGNGGYLQFMRDFLAVKPFSIECIHRIFCESGGSMERQSSQLRLLLVINYVLTHPQEFPPLNPGFFERPDWTELIGIDWKGLGVTAEPQFDYLKRKFQERLRVGQPFLGPDLQEEIYCTKDHLDLLGRKNCPPLRVQDGAGGFKELTPGNLSLRSLRELSVTERRPKVCPFGYHLSERDSRFRVNPDLTPLILRVFELHTDPEKLKTAAERRGIGFPNNKGGKKEEKDLILRVLRAEGFTHIKRSYSIPTILGLAPYYQGKHAGFPGIPGFPYGSQP